MIYCGTCGFSYDDWVGKYYPDGVSVARRLNYYAQEFNALELNSTYYVLPRASSIASMAAKTGEGFRFAVKANQEMTHVRQQGVDLFKSFHHVINPLREAGKLGCVLAQFPNSFRYIKENFDYLKQFYDWMGDVPLVCEFRNAAWLNDAVTGWLRQNKVGFCCVDEPRLPGLLPSVALTTGDIAYLRFHGRNSAKWWHHDQAWERYDYTYSREELEGWMPRIGEMAREAKDTYIFANNHWQAQAVDTIRQVRSMLDQLVL